MYKPVCSLIAARYQGIIFIWQFIEFNDEHDTGSFNESITNSSYVTFMDTTNLDWKVINKSNSSGEASLSVEASGYVDTDKRTQKNGTVRFVVGGSLFI